MIELDTMCADVAILLLFAHVEKELLQKQCLQKLLQLLMSSQVKSVNFILPTYLGE